ncbi:hypothetical protein BDV96DRAFT_640359 [Lophiotrema nucula]|uniref:RING-type domain-containing protein n=1 Tax=Lophiotrema nucula TaxID=690887 RepID=A0A6A5ZRK7_9PLEO|nr:hypothetical protein BDV96DRAFT_640359 [Lophiotrema nucula]
MSQVSSFSFENHEEFRSREPGRCTREEFLNNHIQTCEYPIDGSDCAICKEEYHSDGHQPTQFTHPLVCQHIFGNDCLQQWLKTPKTNTCPMCRCKFFDLEGSDSDSDDEDGMSEGVNPGFGDVRTYAFTTGPSHSDAGEVFPGSHLKFIDNRDIRITVLGLFNSFYETRRCTGSPPSSAARRQEFLQSEDMYLAGERLRMSTGIVWMRRFSM